MTLFFSSNLSAQSKMFWGGSTEPNSTFNNGVNGWTVVGVACGGGVSADSAKWVFCPNGALPTKGAYQGTGGVVNSPSKADGAMGFNSDYFDNGGVAGAFGTGKCPTPHAGYIQSPSLDCSGQSSVELRFYQAIREFYADQRIDVSNDGGVTWVGYPVNTDVVTNSAHINNQIAVNISKTAAGHSDVRLRFVYDIRPSNAAGYYYWVVDDIQLWSLPDNDLSIKNVYFCPNSYNTPEFAIKTDTFQFIADIQNVGGKTQKNVIFKAEVLKGSAVVYSDSMLVDSIAPGLQTTIANGSLLEPNSDSSFVLPKLWAPNLNADTATYYIRYSVYASNQADEKASDNTKQLPFKVSTFSYSKDDGRNISNTSPASTTIDHWSVGAVYNIGNYTGDITFRDVLFNCSRTSANGNLSTTSATLIVAEVNKALGSGLNLTDDTEEYGLAETSDFIARGINEIQFNAKLADTLLITPIDYTDGVSKVVAKNDTRYFVFVKYGDRLTNHGYSRNSYKNYNSGASLVYVDKWYTAGFGNTLQPVIRVNLELKSANDDIDLPESVLKLYPTPADKEMTAEVNFDKTTEATITIADYTGKILSMKDYDGLKNDKLQINTSDYTSGAYLMRIGTKEGTRTVKFVVQH